MGILDGLEDYLSDFPYQQIQVIRPSLLLVAADPEVDRHMVVAVTTEALVVVRLGNSMLPPFQEALTDIMHNDSKLHIIRR